MLTTRPRFAIAALLLIQLTACKSGVPQTGERSKEPSRMTRAEAQAKADEWNAQDAQTALKRKMHPPCWKWRVARETNKVYQDSGGCKAVDPFREGWKQGFGSKKSQGPGRQPVSKEAAKTPEL